MLTKKLHILLQSTAATCATLFAGGVALAEDISNVATVTWRTGTTTRSVPSNEVLITVKDAPPEPEGITFYHFTTPGAGKPTPLPATQCSGNGGMVDLKLSGAFSNTKTTPADIVETKAIRAGEPLILSISQDRANRDAGAIDSLQIVLKGQAPLPTVRR